MSWCTIESDPGVFTELVETIGVQDVEFRELVTLDAEDFARMGTVHGVVFLFKYRPEDYAAEAIRASGGEFDHSESIFFARQTVNNACATQAIINALLNVDTVKDVGETLRDFQSFAGALPPDLRGDCIGNNETIRTTHNSFTVPDPFVSEEKRAKDDDDDDVFHFVSFVPIGGKVYELDGLKQAPLAIGTIGDDQPWYEVLIAHLQERIARFAAGSIKFNLMAMCANRLAAAEAELAAVEAQLAAAQPAGAGGGDAPGVLEQRKAELAAAVADERAERARWRLENRRRRHNYVPLIMKLLGLLADSGDLQPCYDEAETSVRARRAEAAKKEAEKQTAE